MELLVYNKAHWMDALTPQEILDRAKADEHFQAKYDSRYQKGDIVDVKPDGHWTEKHGYNKKCFVVVKIDKKTVDERFTESQDSGDVLVKQRRYWANVDLLTFDVDKKVTVTTISDAEITDKVTDTKVTDG